MLTQKTNALRPLLDRHETPLLCWNIWKRYQRQTVRLYWPPLEEVASFTSERHFSPRPFYATAVVLFMFFCLFHCRTENGELIRVRRGTVSNRLNSKLRIQKSNFWCGDWNGLFFLFLSGSKLLFDFSKGTPNYENLQRRNGPSAPTPQDADGPRAAPPD